MSISIADSLGLSSGEERSGREARRGFDAQFPGLSAARGELLERATALSKRPRTEYQGERVAGLGGNENRALDRAANGYEESRGYYNRAGEQIDKVANNEFNSENIQRYMNPYVEGVVNNTLRKENEAFQQRQNRLRGNAVAAGAFGGDRATLLESQAEQRQLETVGDITAEGYSTAYREAFQGWQADNNRRLGAAQAYDAVGGDLSRLNGDQITELLRTGGADRVVRQLTNDVGYQNFIENRDWDVTNLQPLIQAIQTAGGGNSAGSGGGGSGGGSNAIGNIAGAVSAVVGYFGSRGSTQTSTSTGSIDSSYGPITNTSTVSYSMGG